MFTFLGWFFTVLIVLAVLAAIGWFLLQAYCFAKAMGDPELHEQFDKMEKLIKREQDSYIEEMNLSQDFMDEIHKRERARFASWKTT